MSWNYRIVRTEEKRGGATMSFYRIHEVYYNEDDEPFTLSEKPTEIYTLDHVSSSDESLKTEIVKQLESILEDIKENPVLARSEICGKPEVVICGGEVSKEDCLAGERVGGK
jgi:hypothetical protein